MNERQLLQIQGLFEAALERSPETRPEFIKQACLGDEALLRELQILIKAHEQTSGVLDFLQKSADTGLAFASVPGLEGLRIGPYLIGREIGRGGMGIVYSALRADGAFHKQFAFKVVQSSLASEEIVTRFRREREILSSLDHPNIARLIDAGVTDDGLPFYVMEYIEGQLIDVYCDERRLNVTERINLFRTVCKAVQYAHQNLIVHRDLKPSNILVAADGTIKLLDFGIAKLLNQTWEESALKATATGVRVMTPEYASPEQIKCQPITTATDVYALGVTLYELLTGQTPYGLRNRFLHEIERAICEEEPTRPSTAAGDAVARVSEVNTPPDFSTIPEGSVAKLRRRLSGDIDNILLMALRKEPSRRYPSAEQFSADLGRHLDGLPVLACRDTLAYRTQKFLLRHRLPVGAAVAFLLLLLVGLATTIHLYLSAKAAQASAEAGEVFAWAGGSLNDDPERGLILGLHAWGKQRSMIPGLEQFLHEALLESRARSTLRGHKTSVLDVEWSPIGGKVATASSDHTAKVWDAGTGRELLTLRGHQDSVFSAVWSADGRELATASSDGTAKVWEAATGRELFSLLVGDRGSIASVAWSPDGSRLAAASEATAKVWEAATGRELFALGGPQISFERIAWSPDGSKLATASPNCMAKIWEATTGRELLTLPGNQGSTVSVAWSPDSRMLATASLGDMAKIWDAATGRELLAFRHHFPVWSVAWSPDGTAVGTADLSGTGKIWEAATGHELFTLPVDQKIRSVAWSPDGRKLATASWDGTAKVWAYGRQDLLTLEGHKFPVESVAWSPDGSKLATGGEDGAAKIWEASSGRELLPLRGHYDSVESLAWSPDGTKLATASLDGTAGVWQAASGGNLLTLLGNQGQVKSVAWSPDGSKLATANRGSVGGKISPSAEIWDAATGRQLLILPVDQEEVNNVAWSPDGSKLAAATGSGPVRIWEAVTGRGLFTLRGHGGSIISKLAWSPDSRKLAIAGLLDVTAKVWLVGSRRKLLDLRGHQIMVTSVVWAPDGSKLATAGSDGTATIWDARTGSDLLVLRGHGSADVPVLWSLSGKQLGSAGGRGLGARTAVNSVAWSPDGKRLASAGDDSHVQVYAIDQIELLRLVRSRITRDLTADECHRYLNTDHCPAPPLLP